MTRSIHWVRQIPNLDKTPYYRRRPRRSGIASRQRCRSQQVLFAAGNMDTPRVKGRMIFMPIPPSGRQFSNVRVISPETLRRQRMTEITATAVANANAR
eukprot:5674472-Pleurochrysis_carterae.AAC.1